MKFKNILVEKTETLGYITINRPKKLIALNKAGSAFERLFSKKSS